MANIGKLFKSTTTPKLYIYILQQAFQRISKNLKTPTYLPYKQGVTGSNPVTPTKQKA